MIQIQSMRQKSFLMLRYIIKKRGVGSAIIEGIESCNTSYFCILMADGSTDSKYLQEKLKNV